METKICTRCNVEQEIENFYIRRTRNNQRKSICKECESKQKARPIMPIPDLDGEIWKPFPDFEDILLISNKCRVKRIQHRKNKTEKLIKPVMDSGGYFQICFCHKGKPYQPSFHRCVAKAFIPNPENLPEVDHINDDKSDNRPENLMWSTKVENIRKAWKTGAAKARKGTSHHNSKLTEQTVLEIRSLYPKLSRKELSVRFEITISLVDKIIYRQRWKHL